MEPGIVRYQKRLRQPFAVEWLLLPHSAKSGQAARKEESTAILNRIAPGDFVLLLDETGTIFDSPTLAKRLQQTTSQRPVVCIIGGAYGVDERIKQRADMVWSLSKLVFPHMMVRLLLIEQLYRVQEILKGSPYHHK